MTFVTDGCSAEDMDLWKTQLANARSNGDPIDIVEDHCREDVFKRIHGEHSEAPALQTLNGKPLWNKSYCNLDDAFIDAEACIGIYVRRCQESPSITFRCGSGVSQINTQNSIFTGVTLEDGAFIRADQVIVAAGAWSNSLVDVGDRVQAKAIEVAWIKVTEEEEAKWKAMSITTNYSTGFNLFPPYNGEIKILCRSQGYKHTVTISHPEKHAEVTKISLPRTQITHPHDAFPTDAEARLRSNLREIMPSLANRPFERTKLCW